MRKRHANRLRWVAVFSTSVAIACGGEPAEDAAPVIDAGSDTPSGVDGVAGVANADAAAPDAGLVDVTAEPAPSEDGGSDAQVEGATAEGGGADAQVEDATVEPTPAEDGGADAQLGDGAKPDGAPGADASVGCTLGAKQCVGLVPQTCNGKWSSGAPCPFVCSSGACVGACVPGTKQCSGKVPQTCSATGQWTSGSACPNLCSSGSCAGSCSPGALQCNGNVPQTCSTSGQWSNGTACAYVCQSGKCVGVCKPGEKRCSGNTSQVCGAGGSWAGVQACDYVCDAGDCKNLEYRVGPAEWVFGPDPTLPDSHFTVVDVGGVFRGYSSGGVTRLFEGASVPGLVDKGPTVIGPGSGFDSCGAWLQAVEADAGLLRGWYHAEEKCNYAVGQTHKSVAYAESTDGGKTFVKVGYPNNRVLTGTNAPTTGVTSGAGDHSVVKRGTEYWMYFLDSALWKTAVARAPVSSGGKPGAWLKWQNGQFVSPALGGQSTPLGFLGTNASLHTSSSQVVLTGPNPWFGGVQLSFSADGINFHTMSEPLVPFEEESWARPAPTEFISYPSIVPPVGGKSWSSSFYLFSTYIHPGEGFDKRYLVRRTVNVSTQVTPSAPQVYLALWRYFFAPTYDHWVTTSMVPTGSSYAKHLGYIMTKPRTGAVPLYDCYIASWNDHMLSLSDTCEGATRLRRLGWLWSSAGAQPAGTKALYRCYNAANTNHFVSDSATCEGAGAMEFKLGYAYGQ